MSQLDENQTLFKNTLTNLLEKYNIHQLWVRKGTNPFDVKQHPEFWTKDNPNYKFQNEVQDTLSSEDFEDYVAVYFVESTEDSEFVDSNFDLVYDKTWLG